MHFKVKSILFFFVSLYTILGVNLLLIICNMAMVMQYSFRYYYFMSDSNISLNNLKILFFTFLVMIYVLIYIVITVVVYFFVKNNSWKFTVVFLLILIIMFGKIVLLIIYNSFYNYDINVETAQEMRNDMSKLDYKWKNFQINMKCCGVYDLSDYESNKLDPSCCGHYVNASKYSRNCTKGNSYQMGCYSKLKMYFKEYNQLIIWTGIVFDIFTMLVLILLRYSKMFVVINDELKLPEPNLNMKSICVINDEPNTPKPNLDIKSIDVD